MATALSDLDALYHQAALDHGFKPFGTCDDCGTPLLIIDYRGPVANVRELFDPPFTDAGYEPVAAELLAASALTVEAFTAAEHDYEACVRARAAR
jgi:hypothetical protein